MVRRLLLFVGAGLPAKLRLGVGSCVKILLPGTEPQGLAGRGGAKSGGRRAAGRVKTGVGNVKILLPETEVQGLAGNGEQRGGPICRRNCAQRLEVV